MTPNRVKYFLKKSLEALKLNYVDLYLIHSPMGYQYLSDKDLFPMKDGNVLMDKTTDLEALWKEMEAQVDAALTKSIGISNYNIAQLERMMKVARIPPANLQVNYANKSLNQKLLDATPMKFSKCYIQIIYF